MVTCFDRVKTRASCLEVQYEQLIIEPKATVGRILAFLDARRDPGTIDAMLTPGQPLFVNEVNAYLHPNVGAEPNRSRVDAWQSELTGAEIEAFERIAGPVLIRKGYLVRRKQGSWDKANEIWLITRERIKRFARGLGSISVPIIRKDNRTVRLS
jgi:hypothetical protein